MELSAGAWVWVVSCLLWFGLGAGAFAADEVLEAGPYLVDISDTTVTIAVHTKEPAVVSVVLYGKAEDRYVTSKTAQRSHFLKVDGLEPSRAYRYVLKVDHSDVVPEGGQGSWEFRTAVRKNERFTFAVFGDPRPGETGSHRHFRDIVEQVSVCDPWLYLVLGDMVDHGERREEWLSFLDVQKELGPESALYPVMGDNDRADGKGIGTEFFPKLKEGYYRFRVGDVEFFALDAWDARGRQSAAELGQESDQYKWFIEEISKKDVQRAPFRVVFLHDPVYISRGRSAEILRRVWAPVFAKHRVDVVFASWHLYERLFFDGVHYIVTGGAGAELIWMNANRAIPSKADAKRHHFCRIDVGDGAMTISAIADDGTVLDSLQLTPKPVDSREMTRLESMARRFRKEIMIGAPDAPTLETHIFSNDCNYCERLLKVLLPHWCKRNKVRLRVHYYDSRKYGVYRDLFMAAGADFGRQNAELPAVFVGRSVLGGRKEINRRFEDELVAFAANPDKYRGNQIVPFQTMHDTKGLAARAFESLTPGFVIVAGLLDGVNPCAFTVIIFLISYLSVVGGSRRQMAIVGGLFSFAVFATYLGIGFFLFKIAAWLVKQQGATLIVNGCLLVCLAALSGFSLFDTIRCMMGRQTDVVLQLPDSIKKLIRTRIRRFARQQMAASAAALGLGVIIAALELGCTGQVYLPIVTMIAEPRYRPRAVSYLFTYNIAFIVPLLVVFVLTVFGMTSDTLARSYRKHMVLCKLGLTLLFVVMTLMIMYKMRLI